MDEKFDLPAVIRELFYGDETTEPLEQTLDRLIAPNFVQRVNGQVYRRSEYTAHVREMRQMVVGGGELQVLEQIRRDSEFAGRYLFRMVTAEGQNLSFESHLFARVNNGRIERLIEVARQVENDADEDFLIDI